jgi:hypothetical protein
MRKLVNFVLILVLATALPLIAQEEEGTMHMKAPPPLDDAHMKWMVGEWQGHSTSAMGKSTDYMRCEMGLDGQFMMMTYKSETQDGRKMSGMGAVTHDKEGKLTGYWIDSWRTMSEGHGTREGNISTMNWSTAQGPYVRKTEKVDENTMRITGVMQGPDGKEMKWVTELKRIEK